MSDSLSIEPEFLDVLANVQDNAAADIKYATQMVTGIDEEVATTHGSYTSTFNTVLSSLVAIRNAAGTGLQTLATQVAGNLRTAAKAYSEADEASVNSISNTNF